jgi:hypothetical protein
MAYYFNHLLCPNFLDSKIYDYGRQQKSRSEQEQGAEQFLRQQPTKPIPKFPGRFSNRPGFYG